MRPRIRKANRGCYLASYPYRDPAACLCGTRADLTEGSHNHMGADN